MSNIYKMYSKGIQVKPSPEEDPDMPCSQARMGKWVPNFVGETTGGFPIEI